VARSFAIIFALYCLAVLVLGLFPPGLARRMPGPRPMGIDDMTGRRLALDQPPQRAMIFPPMTYHYLTADATDEHIMSTSEAGLNTNRQPVLLRMFPGLTTREKALTVLNSARPLGVEQALWSRPDALLAWAGSAQDLGNIQYPGLALITVENDGGEHLYRFLGDLTGQRSRTDELWQRGRREIAEIYAALPADTPEIGVLVVANSSYYVWQSLFTDFNAKVKPLKIRNVAEDLSGNVGLETILELNPDLILLNDYADVLRVEDIYRHPVLKSLAAVRNRRVYRVPAGCGPRLSGPLEDTIQLAWLAEKAHPGYMPETPLRQRISRLYADVYNYMISDDEIDELLHINENSR
jgi:iron complex transport system substrate-binding protein